MGVFSREFLDQVKSGINILDLAEFHGFEVQKQGNVYQARCRHEGDATPSLTFFPETNTFHCFGCGINGDIIRFEAWASNLPFKDAVHKLATSLGIQVDDAPDPGIKKLMSKIIKINRIYWQSLRANQHASDYLASRQITQEDVDKWRLGVVPESHSDPYRGRITFAIMDDSSRTVGFAYRILDGTGPKYINSPDSQVFKKSNILYGLNYAIPLIQATGKAVIVEGYTDVIQLQKYGVPAVAVMGSSMSAEQRSRLKRYTSDVIIYLDGDRPGQESTIKLSAQLRADGFTTHAIMTTVDPDEFAIQSKDATLERLLEMAVPVPAYIINLHLSKAQAIFDSAAVECLDTVLPLLSQITNVTELEFYANKIASTLRIDKPAVYQMLTRGGYYGGQAQT